MSRVLYALVALFAPALAFAQSDEAPAEDGPRVIYQKELHLDFDAARVAAEVATPSGAVVLAEKRGQFNPLIRLRADFAPEMLQSIDEVR